MPAEIPTLPAGRLLFLPHETEDTLLHLLSAETQRLTEKTHQLIDEYETSARGLNGLQKVLENSSFQMLRSLLSEMDLLRRRDSGNQDSRRIQSDLQTLQNMFDPIFLADVKSLESGVFGTAPLSNLLQQLGVTLSQSDCADSSMIQHLRVKEKGGYSLLNNIIETQQGYSRCMLCTRPTPTASVT